MVGDPGDGLLVELEGLGGLAETHRCVGPCRGALCELLARAGHHGGDDLVAGVGRDGLGKQFEGVLFTVEEHHALGLVDQEVDPRFAPGCRNLGVATLRATGLLQGRQG